MNLPSKLKLAGLVVPVHVCRHARARRMSLRYDHVRGRVRLTLPHRTQTTTAARFLEQHREWLDIQVEKDGKPEKLTWCHGMELPIYGKPRIVTHVDQARGTAKLTREELVMPAPAGHLKRRTEDWLKLHVRDAILKDAHEFAQKLGVAFQRVTVRDTKTRWGSCNHKGNLSFCWRLVYAPRDILRYVVAHEIAHLKQMNHSDAFWNEVANIYPNYEYAREWLKINGSLLHYYH